MTIREYAWCAYMHGVMTVHSLWLMSTRECACITPQVGMTIRECAADAMEGRGIRGLYRGVGSQLTGTVLGGLLLVGFEEVKCLLF
mmetsp:Transcript_46475/g.92772  ORF Transcript_46475/g.92772 Transcript_46475/m.92772 type:complete len:86 (-) Transcript_46475:124-381(-)